MVILGDIYLYSTRTGSAIDINLENLNEFVSKYGEIEEELAKVKFLNGLEKIFYESPLYCSDWIDILIDDYLNSETIDLKSQLLRNLAYLTQKLELEENDKVKYIKFFSSQLQELLTNDFELPENSIVYKPNIIQDLLNNIEQLAYSSLLIVEEILPLYEQVFSKYVTSLEKGPTFFGLTRQWIHSIYTKLINYYKIEVNSKKLTEYFTKTTKVSLNEIEKLELSINSLKHEIGIAISNKNLTEAKVLFNDLNNLFNRYEEIQNIKHVCFPTWKIIEDILYITTCRIQDRERDIGTLRIDLKKFQKHVP